MHGVGNRMGGGSDVLIFPSNQSQLLEQPPLHTEVQLVLPLRLLRTPLRLLRVLLAEAVRVDLLHLLLPHRLPLPLVPERLDRSVPVALHQGQLGGGRVSQTPRDLWVAATI